MIESKPYKDIVGEGKTIVFTAYLYEESYGDKGKTEVTDCWYPTVFFHDLEQNKIFWRVFGAEVFIQMTKNNKVFILSNRIWKKIDKKVYDELVDSSENFSRFQEFHSSVFEINYMEKAINDTSGYVSMLDISPN